MKTHAHPARRAAWLLMAAPALIAIPAQAQEAPTAPPPVRVTVPQVTPPPPTVPTATPAPAPEPVAATPAADVPPAPSPTTIAPGALDVVDDDRRPAPRATRTAPQRQATRTVATRTAPQPAVPVAVAPAASVAAGPAPVAETVATAAPAPAPEPAPVVADITSTTTVTDDGSTPLWPIAVIAALIVAAGAFVLLRRRRTDEDVYVEDEEYVAEPSYVQPVAAAPIAAGVTDDTTVSDAPAEDVAALTEGAPPVRDRPWLEFAMRPVRAGTSADEALVEIELTVANSGSVEAHDVRVSTFMLTDAHASEMERMMVDAPADAAIDPIDIAPGQGTRIDATLAALKSDLGVDGPFHPVVVAEARYRLADGTEGRTSASFVVGVSDVDGGVMTGIDLADRVMRDDVEAQLHGEVEHA